MSNREEQIKKLVSGSKAAALVIAVAIAKHGVKALDDPDILAAAGKARQAELTAKKK